MLDLRPKTKMFRYIIPTILIGLSVTIFLTFTSSLYKDISLLRAKVGSYDEALTNSVALEKARDALTQKNNSIDPENLLKLKKLLPDSVDNIRLILEIEKIGVPYGMALRDVKYDTDKTSNIKPGTPVQGGAAVQTISREYGVWTLGFSTTGTYANFSAFLKDLESNLRIVDIESITFTSDVGGAVLNPSFKDAYKYDFKIKTYWLKN